MRDLSAVAREAGATRMARVAALLSRHAPLLSLLMLAGVSVLSFGVTRLGFNADYKVFFDEENQELRDNDTLNSYFNKRETILFVIKSEKGSIFSKQTLDISRFITDASWSVPYAIRVDSLANHPRTTATESEVVVRDLIPEGLELTEDAVADIRDYALAQPEIVDKLVARDGGATGILVTLQLPESDPLAPVVAVQRAEAIIDEVKSSGAAGLQLGLTGLIPIAAAYPKASQSDIARLTPLILAMTMIALLVQLRSLTGMLSSVLVIVLSSTATFGYAGWSNTLLTPPAVMAPLIIMSVAIADCVHVLMSIGRARAQGQGTRDPIEEGLARALIPVSLTSFTTAAGFLTLNLAESPPYRDLGNMAAVGAVVAWSLSITLLPALARLLPKGWFARQPGKVSLALSGFLARIALARSAAALVAGALVVLALFPLGARLTIDDNIVEYFDESTQIRRDTELALDHLTGVYTVEFAVSAGGQDKISTPSYLKRLEDFTAWLREQPEVVAVDSFADRIKEMNRSLHGDDDAWRRLPESPEQAAQYILLYEYSLPYGRELTDQIDLRKSMTRVVAYLDRVSTSQIIEVKERAQSWLSEQGFERPLAAGVVVIFSYLSHHNINAMAWGTLWMLLIISLIVAAYAGRWRLALIASSANIAPPVMALCLWGGVQGYLNTPSSTAVVVALGLIVDSTIHLLYGFHHHRFQLGKNVEDSVKRTLEEVGPPIAVSSLTLLLGFLIIAGSDFRMNADLGLLTAIMIATAALFDLLVIPAALARFGESTSALRLKAAATA